MQLLNSEISADYNNIRLGLQIGSLMSLSDLFQFYWFRKVDYSEKLTDPSQLTDA
jgi:hypothetical protein